MPQLWPPQRWSLGRKLTAAYLGSLAVGAATGASLMLHLVLLRAEIDEMPLDASLPELQAAHRAASAHAREAVQATVASLFLCGILAGALTFLILHTVVSLRRRQNVMREYLQRVESSNRDLDAFAGRIAHDMRNLLAPLAMVPAMLRRAGEAAPEHPSAPAINRVADGMERRMVAATRVLDGLLAFSRAGNHEEDGKTTSVAAVLEEVLDELEPLRQRIGVVVDRHIEDAPACCSPGLVHVLVANLVSNAMKFLEGRPSRRVRVACTRSADGCCIEVQDSGCGIAPQHLDRIFEPFFRVPGAVVEGFGIGLATVRRIVQAHGGEIHLASTLGCGTTARVLLPCRDRPTPSPEPPPQEPSL